MIACTHECERVYLWYATTTKPSHGIWAWLLVAIRPDCLEDSEVWIVLWLSLINLDERCLQGMSKIKFQITQQ